MTTSTVRAFSMALGLITAICGNAAPPAPVNPVSSLKEATPASYGYAVQGRELVVVDRHSFAVAKRIALDERVNRVLAHPAGDSVFLLTETSVLRLNPYSWTIDGRIALSRSSAWAISWAELAWALTRRLIVSSPFSMIQALKGDIEPPVCFM